MNIKYPLHNLNDEELDIIVNYNNKYRIGKKSDSHLSKTLGEENGEDY